MKVQVNTSNDVENKEALGQWATDYLQDHLARFAGEITTIEVQLTDENHATKGGDDKRCMMAARVPGRADVAVTHTAADQNLAFRGATTKLEHALERIFGKLDRRDHRDRESIRHDPGALTAEVPARS